MQIHIFLLLLVAVGLTWANDEDFIFHNYKVGQPMTLVCENSKDDKAKQDVTDDVTDEEGIITWLAKVNNSDTFQIIQAEENRIQIDNEKKELTIREMQKADMGKYRCKIGNKIIKGWEVTDLKFRLLAMKKSYSVSIGEDTNEDMLRCEIKGEADVAFIWYAREEGNEDKSSNKKICPNNICSAARQSIRLAQHGKASVLKMENVTVSDRKIYTCRAVPKELESEEVNCTKAILCFETQSLLRVKDPLAAVWPFIGIVIEVILLCIIIFFCERRRDSKEAEEMEEDEGYNGNNAATSNSNIRQRK